MLLSLISRSPTCWLFSPRTADDTQDGTLLALVTLCLATFLCWIKLSQPHPISRRLSQHHAEALESAGCPPAVVSHQPQAALVPKQCLAGGTHQCLMLSAHKPLSCHSLSTLGAPAVRLTCLRTPHTGQAMTLVTLHPNSGPVHPDRGHSSVWSSHSTHVPRSCPQNPRSYSGIPCRPLHVGAITPYLY